MLDKEERLNFLVMGSLNYDYTYSVDHIVKPGETISSERLNAACGGKGFNQAVALAKAGARVYLAGMAGKDGFGIVEEAKEYGVNCSFIKESEERTGNAIIQVDQGGQNCIVLFGGANRTWTEAHIEAVLRNFRAGDALVLQNEVNLVPWMIARATEKKMQIILNPSPFEKEIMSWELQKISLFLINEVEGEQMTGESEPEYILNQLEETFPEAEFVLTLGEKGAWYTGKGQRHFCHAKQVKAIDTTAAGDTFTGYFLAERQRGSSIPECLETAAKAAALAVSRKGAAVSIPVLDEVVDKE